MFTNMKYYILLQECYLKFTVSQVNLPVFSIQFFFSPSIYICQLKVFTINSMPTGVPVLECIEKGNFIIQ